MCTASPDSLAEKNARLNRLCDFIFEAGMLRRTPRSGYQFLGSGRENVAEHSFRCALIGLVLAELAELAEPSRNRLVALCLIHDFHEARTGDLNYVNKVYASLNVPQALQDALAGTGLEGVILPLQNELDAVESPESRLAHDADQLDLIFNLREEEALGNPQAALWLDAVEKRLRTPEARALAAAARKRDHTRWWKGTQM